MSKVSVIVPVYNAGKKLNKCIKSILNQTFADFELLLINDGSTDASLKICNKYKLIDQRITVINKKNEGSIPTRKKGVELANSEYIMFVDADDWIAAETLEILYNKTIQNQTNITVCNMYKVFGKGHLIKKEVQSRYFTEDKLYLEKEIKSELVTAYFWGHPFPSSLCAKLYKKELLLTSGKYLNRINFMGDDLFYNLEMLLKAKRVKIINKPLYFYRQDGFTSRYMKTLFNDAVNGYKIQKEVIDEYYKDTLQQQYNGISLMLLNTLKTCLYNLFCSDLSVDEIKEIIRNYTLNESVKECIYNEKSKTYFPKEYLKAIEQNNVEYLFQLGKEMYKKRIPRKIVSDIITKLAIV
ncbi:glycosyltransferase family 2 protein [Neobacillus sp. 179-C4.2 HS]|uniref:Glycosyltransferase family 2 protein n=1 Tax=Neobacillus driksii TaxID=3035913 RepID=A0ABV4Z0P7_9BACI|nr:glycosyltransferase family 2 protein [Neobacillus sp. 179.-C4.2 HS]MDP5195972.1 glycosyltransferase family 2 protein [Neobacillus sp. 179.-C4.2 HS]